MPGTYRCPAETGFYYLQSRYYDPVIRRFINADGFVSTGQGLLGYNMFTYCGNNPVIYFDPSGNAWILNGVYYVYDGSAEDFHRAEHGQPPRAYEYAKNILAAEHRKKGTTSPSKRNKHEEGQARKQRDNGGEKGDARRRPNPNKRRKYSVNEKVVSGLVIAGCVVTIVYLAANDATIVGAADDGAIAAVLPIIWDNVVKITS